MLLYERLIGPPERLDPELLRLRDQIHDAVLVVVDNVARFYFADSPQEDWRLDQHFPNIAPPWPHAFYEYKVPTQLNVRGKVEANPFAETRIGLLMHAQSVEDVLTERRERRGDRPLSNQERR